MLKLKVAMPFGLDATLNVRVAVKIWFALSTVFSRSQTSVMGPLALAGFQFAFVKLKVNGMLPVFLT